MPSDEESERIQHTGFIAGMLRTRRGLDPEMGEPEMPDSRLDPFMVGYKQGAKARGQIITEAVEQIKPHLDARAILHDLMSAAEDTLVAVEAGHGFSLKDLADEAARARVYLKEHGDD